VAAVKEAALTPFDAKDDVGDAAGYSKAEEGGGVEVAFGGEEGGEKSNKTANTNDRDAGAIIDDNHSGPREWVDGNITRAPAYPKTLSDNLRRKLGFSKASPASRIGEYCRSIVLLIVADQASLGVQVNAVLLTS